MVLPYGRNRVGEIISFILAFFFFQLTLFVTGLVYCQSMIVIPKRRMLAYSMSSFGA
jgi:hypothetical protein